MSGPEQSGMNESLPRVERHVLIHSKYNSYRVEIKLGEGSFGKVVRCRKLDTEEIMAIKVLKPKPNAGKAEIKALKALRKLDADKTNLIKFYEGFNYQGHTCLVFEYLNESLFDFFVHRKVFPLHVSEIRVIAQQLLVALDALKSIGLVHCDIKADNIMLVDHVSQPFKVKLVDFGNAMKTSTLEMVKRIQALGYRAPEVVLGLPLDEAVDTWGLSCVLALVFIGRHVYPLQSEYEFIRVITQLHSLPEDEVLRRGSNVNTFFTLTEDSGWRLNTKMEYKRLTGNAAVEDKCVDKYIKSFDDLPKLYPGLDDPVEEKDTQAFMSLLKRLLHVNPAKRITPRQALGHRFITMAHLSCESKGLYVTLARANMRESQLEEVPVERNETSSETLDVAGPAAASSDHQLSDYGEDDEDEPSTHVGTHDTEDRTDSTSREETLQETETSQEVVVTLQGHRQFFFKTGRVETHVRPQISAKQKSSVVTKKVQPEKPEKCVAYVKQSLPICEAKVTAKGVRASTNVSNKPAPDTRKKLRKLDNADKNIPCSAENPSNIAEVKSKQKGHKRIRTFFARICGDGRGSE